MPSLVSAAIDHLGEVMTVFGTTICLPLVCTLIRWLGLWAERAEQGRPAMTSEERHAEFIDQVSYIMNFYNKKT